MAGLGFFLGLGVNGASGVANMRFRAASRRRSVSAAGNWSSLGSFGMKGLGKPSTNEDKNNFHMWLGYCIAGWSNVEDSLFQTCWRCLNCEAELASIVYFRNPGLDIRLNLTDELIRAVLPRREQKDGGHDHPSVKQWTEIRNDLKSMLSTRRGWRITPSRCVVTNI